MDIETIKRKYGNPNRGYYVYCDKCPVNNINEPCPTGCNGREDAWYAIYRFINKEEPPYTPTVEPTQSDSVNHPAHYNRGKIEVADFIYDQQLNFNRGNAIKYICRAGFKGDMAEDLEKAIWYLNHELKMLRG